MSNCVLRACIYPLICQYLTHTSTDERADLKDEFVGEAGKVVRYDNVGRFRRAGHATQLAVVVTRTDTDLQANRIVTTDTSLIRISAAKSEQCHHRHAILTNRCTSPPVIHYRSIKSATATLVIAPRSRKPTPEALRYGTRCQGSHSFTCIPTRLSANGMNHAFTFPAEAGPHFTDPRGMRG